MDEKDRNTTKGRKIVIPSSESFVSPDAEGWLFKLIHEGWLRKRWRKRYCILSNGILYLYEQQKSDGSAKTCSTVSLNNFGECVKAPRKECKKSPNTLILEPMKQKEGTVATKNAKQIVREFFYTETSEDQDKWLTKLQDSLSLANIGGNAKLKHITKTRARPPRGSGGNRRPPSKQHLKERAMMSEVSLDAQQAEQADNGPAKKRGHIPVNALKLPPGGGKFPALTPKSPTSTKLNGVSEATGNGTKASDSSTPPTSPLRSPITPKPPPAALKPTSTKRVTVVRTDSVSSAGSNKSSLESPLPEMTTDENDKSSMSSSRTSSLGKKENESFSTPSTPPPLSENSKIVDENHNDEEGVVEESNISPAKIEKLKDNGFEIELIKHRVSAGERIMKARSMMNLDRDSEEEEPLPPPPSPPPAETNGDIPNDIIKKDKKTKKKKKPKKTRPASLVLDI